MTEVIQQCSCSFPSCLSLAKLQMKQCSGLFHPRNSCTMLTAFLLLFAFFAVFFLINYILLCCFLDSKLGEALGGSIAYFSLFCCSFLWTLLTECICFLGRITDMLSALMFRLHFISAQENRGNSPSWVWQDFFGATLVTVFEELFRIRAVSPATASVPMPGSVPRACQRL